MDWEHIKLARVRREQIKQQINALQQEDAEIVSWLDMELVVNKLTNESQVFENEQVKVRAKVPQNFKTDEDAFRKVTSENPDFQEIASQLFRWKLEVSEGAWNKATEDIKKLFAPAVTITPGKTQYEFSDIKEK